MKICADFRFHPVGHGLFYSGVINGPGMQSGPFTFVYDCGGRDSGNRFKCFWGQFKKRGLDVRLSMLVISHFHYDHISGIPRLIKLAKPRSIVLPYLYPKEKIAYVASLLAESELEDATADLETISKFILSPETFCRSYCENYDCQIYYINPRRKNAKEGRNRRALDMDSNELYFPEAKLAVGRRGVFDVPNGSTGNIAGWQFRFFMPKKASNCEAVTTWLAHNGIDANSIVSGKFDFNKLKNKFSSMNLRNNLSNLVCMHGPSAADVSWIGWSAGAGCSCNGGRGNLVKCFYPLSCEACGMECWRRCEATIQVLTGDAEFGKAVPLEIKKIPRSKCFLFQIPHHGSKNGWRDWFNELPSCKLRPVTHRWNCTYNGKPFMTDRENLIDACHITESSMSALNVRMFVWDGAGDEL